jgi:heptosyltransferase-2
MVWHLPHIRAITEYVGEPVTVLAKPRSLADQLLRHEPAVSRILWLDRNPGGRRGGHDGMTGFAALVSLLREHRFATAIVLHKSQSLAAATLLAGIPDRRGYGWGAQRLFLNNGPFLPREVARLRPHARATCYLRAAGIPLPSDEPSLAIPPSTRLAARQRLGDRTSPFVVLGIGSSEDLRRWNIDRFATLAAALLAAGWPIVVLAGGPGDAAAAASVQASLGQQIRLAIGWPLDELAGLLAEAAFYAGNDTGVMNMAAAAGIRAYALFGRTPPISHASQIVGVVTSDIGVHDGVARVTPAMVLDTILADRARLSP